MTYPISEIEGLPAFAASKLKAQGIQISRKRIIRLMQEQGLKGKTRRSWVKTSVDLTVGGLARRYLVVRPSVTTGAALPVVVVLHGRWVTPELEVTRTASLFDLAG